MLGRTMQSKRSALVVLAVVCSAAVHAEATTTWWDRSPWTEQERGFHFYPDPVDPRAPEKKNEESPPKPKTIYQMTNLEDIKKELERLKGVAVINPTEKAVLEYLRAQNWVMDKSSMFADVSRRVVWANPDINYEARSPVANFSLQNKREREAAKREQLLKDLSTTHGILFFARSDCEFCKDQAKVLKGFLARSGIPILTISLDGGPISMFPDAKKDNGISMVVSGGNGIQQVPALFLIDKKTKATMALGAGVIAGDDIAERIKVLVTTKPGQEF